MSDTYKHRGQAKYKSKNHEYLTKREKESYEKQQKRYWSEKSDDIQQKNFKLNKIKNKDAREQLFDI